MRDWLRRIIGDWRGREEPIEVHIQELKARIEGEFDSITMLKTMSEVSQTKTFWRNKHARAILDGGHPKGQAITMATSFDGVPLPLCVGTQRYYKEIGRLK